MQLSVVLEAMERILACLLMALLLRIAFAASAFVPVDDNLRAEEGRAVFRLRFIKQDVFQFHLMFLTPFQEFALEVHLFVCQLVDVDEALQYPLLHEALAMSVSSVEIDGSDEGFEGVTCKVAVVRLIVLVSADELVETYLRRQSSERFPLHNLASSIRQEAFSFAREMMENYLAHDCIEDCVAKKLEPLVIEGVSFFVMSEHRLVHQGLLIEAYLVRIEAQHITKSATKFPVLAEG